MDRKNFISSIAPLGLAASGISTIFPATSRSFTNSNAAIPPYLKPGDTIAISSPGGYMSTEDIQPAVNKMKEWGYAIHVGETIGKRDFGFGGTDNERRNDLQQLLDDVKVKAIMCARGGYGAVRIIDQLDFSRFIKSPKWIIGFSDITVMHSHIHQQFNIASIHSKMCNSFPDNWASAEPVQLQSINSIKQCLEGTKMQYNAIPATFNRNGMGIGQLVGGNLKTLESLAGSASDINTAGKILFVEDTGEYLYSIDRMFWNLERSGKLSHLKGLIVGGFKAKKDDPGEEFGKTLEQIVLEKVSQYNYPVCFDFPVGHQKFNMALKCGVVHRLGVSETQVILEEV